MRITIDPESGFCFGVEYAVAVAEALLESEGVLYCLGDIVHNDEEVKRLRQKGLRTITHEELRRLRGVPVLIRAHGEPPETYEIARQNELTLIDASCPVVLKLQNRVKQAHDAGYQVVIYGKPEHPEVRGLVGQTQGEALVISSEAELERIDWSRPIALFSQTTKSLDAFYRLKAAVEVRQPEARAFDTICRQVSNRDEHLAAFAREHDVILFVAGRKSSNGRTLYELCRAHNARTYFIENETELDPAWFEGAQSVGICGATSTPRWLMERVAEAVRNRIEAPRERQ
ncbi:MAG: 4-hydroxy-3-methylbut-2-enyl diphosphate reductase [Bacteroidetes bacterium]|nr:4-hydroxy-3-methylbut-2-enyl diphosphate reductase [Bacteroidota bacterium]